MPRRVGWRRRRSALLKTRLVLVLPAAASGWTRASHRAQCSRNNDAYRRFTVGGRWRKERDRTKAQGRFCRQSGVRHAELTNNYNCFVWATFAMAEEAAITNLELNERSPPCWTDAAPRYPDSPSAVPARHLRLRLRRYVSLRGSALHGAFKGALLFKENCYRRPASHSRRATSGSKFVQTEGNTLSGACDLCSVRQLGVNRPIGDAPVSRRDANRRVAAFRGRTSSPAANQPTPQNPSYYASPGLARALSQPMQSAHPRMAM